MPMDTPVYIMAQGAGVLKPHCDPSLAARNNVNLSAGTYTAGMVLGQVTTSANDVQTITITGAPAGGSFTVVGQNPAGNNITSGAIPFNATAVQAQSAIDVIYGAGNTVVTGTGPYVVTFSGALALQPVPVMVLGTNSLTGGTTPTATVAHTTTGVSAGQFRAYASGNSDGSQTARGLLEMDCVVDASGLVQFSSAAAGTGGLWGERQRYVGMWYRGTFMTKLLTGLDTAAVTAMGGHLIKGTVADGLLEIG